MPKDLLNELPDVPKTGQDLLEEVEPLVGMVPGVDYRVLEGSPSLSTRFQIGRQSDRNETEAYLDKKFGSGNWAKAGSRYVIRAQKAKELGIDVKPGLGGVGDQPVVINPFGLDMGDVAEFAGSVAGPLAGGVAGGIAGGGLGFVPGVLLSGAGSAGGKALDEGVKYLEGTSRRPFSEIAQDVATEGITGAASEGVFRLAVPALSKILGPHTTRDRAIFGARSDLRSTVEPDRLALTQEALESGYRPHISTATGKNLAGRVQSAAEFIFGKGNREEINRSAMMEARNMLATDAGSVARAPDQLIRGEGGFGSIWTVTRNGKRIQTFVPQKGDLDVVNGGPQVATTPGGQIEQAGNKISESLESVNQNLTHNLAEADMLSRVAQRQLEGDLYKSFVKPDTATGLKVKQGVENYKRAFYNQASEGYRVFDEMMGGAAIDVRGVKSLANDMLNSGLMKTAEDGSKVPVQAGMEESISFLNQLSSMDGQQTAQAVLAARNALKTSMDGGSALPGTSLGMRRQLLEALDGSLDDAVSKSGEAGQHLSRIRSWEADEAQKLNSYEIQRLALDPGRAGSLSDDQIVGFISDLKSPDQIERIKSVLPAATWRRVQRGSFDQMMNDVSSPNGVVDARSLYSEIQDRGASLDSLYGKDKAQQIRVYSKFLVAKGGEIDLHKLPQGDPYTVLRNAAAAQQKMDSELATNPDIMKMVSKGKYNPIDLVPSLLKTNNLNQIDQLKRVLGEGSEGWQQFKAASMEKILQPLVSKSKDAVSAVLDPAKLDESLKAYSPEVLNSIFGQQTTQDLYKFAQLARFATSQKSIFAGQIVAASIAMHPLANLGALAKFKAIQNLMATPGFIKYMTDGITNPAARGALREVTRMSAQTASRINEIMPRSTEDD